MHPLEQIVSSLEKLDDLIDLILAALLRCSGFVLDPGETSTEKTTKKATPELTKFIDRGGTPSSLFFDASTSVHLTWLDFIFTVLGLIRRASFAFGLGTTVMSPKNTTERDLVEKETPRIFIFDPCEIPTCIILTVSVVVAVDEFCLGYLRQGRRSCHHHHQSAKLGAATAIEGSRNGRVQGKMLLDVLFGLTMVMDHTLCLGSTLHFGPLPTGSN